MKKGFMCFASFAAAAAMAVPLTANSICKTHSDFSGMTRLDEKYYEMFGIKDDETAYIESQNGSYIWAVAPFPADDYFAFSVADGVEPEQITALLEENLDTDIKLVMYVGAKPFDFTLSVSDGKKVCELLKENELVKDFVMIRDRCVVRSLVATDRLGMYTSNRYDDISAIDGLDTGVSEDSDLSARLETALDIWTRFGIFPMYVTPATSGGEIETVIDVFNAVNGDSNNDNELTIADATLILQHIGNPDKYGLSAQGAFNADIFNCGDGISALDALEIQKILAE